MDLTAADKDFLVKFSCQIIRSRLKGDAAPPMVKPSSKAVLYPAGVFVSLHHKQTHALRGCIGRVDASNPLLSALGNVSWQVSGDHRFSKNPVTTAELASLTIELSILGLLKPAATPLDFEPGKDGMYLAAGGRAGLFLPQVARETGWTREQLLDRLCSEKLGLPVRMWQNLASRFFTFDTDQIGPVDFSFEDVPLSTPRAEKVEK
jgi:AmmeMemoRadiSam system protein A